MDLGRITRGNAEDIEMCENDVLQVPDSTLKNFGRGFIDLFAGVFSIGL